MHVQEDSRKILSCTQNGTIRFGSCLVISTDLNDVDSRTTIWVMEFTQQGLGKKGELGEMCYAIGGLDLYGYFS
eukprot:931614-Amphidinium_carterae.1